MANWPTDRYPSSAQAYEYIPQMWSARVLDAVKSNLVAVNVVDTTWKSQLVIGDKVWIPVGSSLNAGDVDVGSDLGGNINTDFGATAVSITIDTWKECPVQIDDGTKLQTQVRDLVSKLGDRAGYEISKAIDTDVNTLFQGLTATWQGTDGQTFSDDLLISLMEGLDEADVPRTNRALVIDPSCLADMWKIDKFVHRDYNRTLTGEMGKTPYGDSIFITTNLSDAGTGSYGAYLHKEAIGLVMQQSPKIDNFRWDLRHSDIVNVHSIWGCDVLRVTFGAEFYTRKQ